MGSSQKFNNEYCLKKVRDREAVAQMPEIDQIITWGWSISGEIFEYLIL